MGIRKARRDADWLTGTVMSSQQDYENGNDTSGGVGVGLQDGRTVNDQNHEHAKHCRARDRSYCFCTQCR